MRGSGRGSTARRRTHTTASGAASTRGRFSKPPRARPTTAPRRFSTASSATSLFFLRTAPRSNFSGRCARRNSSTPSAPPWRWRGGGRATRGGRSEARAPPPPPPSAATGPPRRASRRTRRRISTRAPTRMRLRDRRRRRRRNATTKKKRSDTTGDGSSTPRGAPAWSLPASAPRRVRVRVQVRVPRGRRTQTPRAFFVRQASPPGPRRSRSTKPSWFAEKGPAAPAAPTTPLPRARCGTSHTGPPTKTRAKTTPSRRRAARRPPRGRGPTLETTPGTFSETRARAASGRTGPRGGAPGAGM